MCACARRRVHAAHAYAHVCVRTCACMCVRARACCGCAPVRECARASVCVCMCVRARVACARARACALHVCVGCVNKCYKYCTESSAARARAEKGLVGGSSAFSTVFSFQLMKRRCLSAPCSHAAGCHHMPTRALSNARSGQAAQRQRRAKPLMPGDERRGHACQSRWRLHGAPACQHAISIKAHTSNGHRAASPRRGTLRFGIRARTDPRGCAKARTGGHSRLSGQSG